MHVGIANRRWRGKRSRHSRRMRNQQFYVSCKSPLNQPLQSEQYASYISYIIHENNFREYDWLAYKSLCCKKKCSPFLKLGLSGQQWTYCGCTSVDLKLFLIFHRDNKYLFYDHHMRSWCVWGRTSEENISVIMLITVNHTLGNAVQYEISHTASQLHVQC